MPSHQDKLAAVRAACRRANPFRIQPGGTCTECGGSECPCEFRNPEPDSIADVLLALGKHWHTEVYIHDGNARIHCYQSDGHEPLWNLAVPLSAQTPEAVDAIYRLLRKEE